MSIVSLTNNLRKNHLRLNIHFKLKRIFENYKTQSMKRFTRKLFAK